MTRGYSEPTKDARGTEEHPGWGVIAVHRGSYGPRGATLFDSDVRHHETITVSISTASRQRHDGHDYIHPRRELVEVEMSLAQWASFVSSMNNGSGVPCTIRRTETDLQVDTFPHEARLQESMAYTHEAANKAFDAVKAAFAVVKEKPTKANIRQLEIVLENSVKNVDYATKTLSEHAENVVQRSRADIEAMVLKYAEKLGIDPSTMPTLALETGGREEPYDQGFREIGPD